MWLPSSATSDSLLLLRETLHVARVQFEVICSWLELNLYLRPILLVFEQWILHHFLARVLNCFEVVLLSEDLLIPYLVEVPVAEVIVKADSLIRFIRKQE